jgi:hypothetical protein
VSLSVRQGAVKADSLDAGRLAVQGWGAFDHRMAVML